MDNLDKEFQSTRLQGMIKIIQNYLDDYPETALLFMAMENRKLNPEDMVTTSDISYVIEDGGDSLYLSEMISVMKRISGIDESHIDLFGGTQPLSGEFNQK